ncbi:hypothetical protein AO1008_09581 [Aspergillus oryzae 100-8]|uniref:Uncharacterized protein n=1 Tax=Aspergillus oryzae (strain 3.042) TaxID=1160506 RepID=I7ZZ76_ASPO3|nr:hypothetical protein Ao3042_06143 [Aspergillus oryzae 3.042]KDE83006.1 hypothetical protein AO1008_09581 [Aspergillus oryzae 100-8]|eukprot:EIT77659.1 hypothetical protein Ao3042_06143 [Aspergillus oryzae 3.042]
MPFTGGYSRSEVNRRRCIHTNGFLPGTAKNIQSDFNTYRQCEIRSSDDFPLELENRFNVRCKARGFISLRLHGIQDYFPALDGKSIPLLMLNANSPPKLKLALAPQRLHSICTAFSLASWISSCSSVSSARTVTQLSSKVGWDAMKNERYSPVRRPQPT